MGLGCCRASSQLENVNNARMIQINHPTELSGVSARPGVDSQLDLKRVEKGAISHCQSWHDCRGGPGTSATGANPSYHDSIATHKGSERYLPTLLETTELQPEKIVEYLQKILRSTPQDEGQKMQNLRLSLLWCDCGFIVQPHDNHDHCCRRSAYYSDCQQECLGSHLLCICYAAHLLHQIQVQCWKIQPLSGPISP